MIQHIISWAHQQESIRAVLLTSTRTRPDAKLDPFSDYDVILVVEDVRPWFEDRRWLADFGDVLVVYRDPIRTEHGFERFAYITQYEHTKIDFTVMQLGLMQAIVNLPKLPDDLDVGYEVLLDKAHITDRLQPPSYQAFIPKPPTEAHYHEAIEVFFHEATYVAKNIWRDELLPAKYSFDQVMKQHFIREMLEWHIQLDHNWSLKVGNLGKGLKQHVRADLWQQLEQTYVGVDPDENWEALFSLIRLYRQVAVEVGEALGYAYPHELDARMDAYLQRVRKLP